MAWNVSEGLLGESLIQKVQNCSVTVRREMFQPANWRLGKIHNFIKKKKKTHNFWLPSIYCVWVNSRLRNCFRAAHRGKKGKRAKISLYTGYHILSLEYENHSTLNFEMINHFKVYHYLKNIFHFTRTTVEPGLYPREFHDLQMIRRYRDFFR